MWAMEKKSKNDKAAQNPSWTIWLLIRGRMTHMKTEGVHAMTKITSFAALALLKILRQPVSGAAGGFVSSLTSSTGSGTVREDTAIQR